MLFLVSSTCFRLRMFSQSFSICSALISALAISSCSFLLCASLGTTFMATGCSEWLYFYLFFHRDRGTPRSSTRRRFCPKGNRNSGLLFFWNFRSSCSRSLAKSISLIVKKYYIIKRLKWLSRTYCRPVSLAKRWTKA